jgi:hypothetical protein
MTREKEPVSKMRPRHFAISTFHFSLGAGVTPAEGSVKPTAGFTFNKVICPSLRCSLTVLADRAMRLSSEYESSFIAGMHP